VTSIGLGAFQGCTLLTTVEILPGSQLKILSECAFYDCTSLKTITIPSSVTSIDKEAFYACSSLTTVTISSSSSSLLTSIGSTAFYACYSLETIEIPLGVKTIEDCAFQNCISLTTVEIPSSVTSIGSNVFEWCTSLTAISVDKKNKKYCSADGVLFNKDKTELIRYPSGKHSKHYKVPSTVLTISPYAFSGSVFLETIYISNVKTIGQGAFDECANLQNKPSVKGGSKK